MRCARSGRADRSADAATSFRAIRKAVRIEHEVAHDSPLKMVKALLTLRRRAPGTQSGHGMGLLVVRSMTKELEDAVGVERGLVGRADFERNVEAGVRDLGDVRLSSNT